MKTLLRPLLITVGFLSLALGLIGIAVPVLPTTPFVLVAAACFARSSTRFYDALYRSRVFGPFIDNYQCGTGIPKQHKIVTLTILWLGLAISSFLVHRAWIIALLAVIGTAVTWHVASMKTRQPAVKQLPNTSGRP